MVQNRVVLQEQEVLVVEVLMIQVVQQELLIRVLQVEQVHLQVLILEEVVVIHAPEMESEAPLFDPGQLEELEASGMSIRCSSDLAAEIPDLDVVYINAIAWVGDSYEVHGGGFRLTRDLPFKPEAIVLHPLARGPELSTCLDDTPHNWYFSQARGAVFLRMALLTCMVNRAERVMDVI